MSWSASQYSKFEDERTRPVRDLLAAVPTAAAAFAVDLGCGPGNSTELLAARYPQARISGIDTSADMIAAARRRLPDLDFAIADVSTWQAPGPCDVLLSNAVMHWLPDHATLLPRLLNMLAANGTLAIQMPDNLAEPSHVLMETVAQAGPWAAKLADAGGARTPLGSVDTYYTLLRPLCRRVDVWRTTYYHPIPGADGIIEWLKGSGLQPYLAPLDTAERAAFLDSYRAAVAPAYTMHPDGRVLLAFPRLFIVATR